MKREDKVKWILPRTIEILNETDTEFVLRDIADQLRENYNPGHPCSWFWLYSPWKSMHLYAHDVMGEMEAQAGNNFVNYLFKHRVALVKLMPFGWGFSTLEQNLEAAMVDMGYSKTDIRKAINSLKPSV